MSSYSIVLTVQVSSERSMGNRILRYVTNYTASSSLNSSLLQSSQVSSKVSHQCKPGCSLILGWCGLPSSAPSSFSLGSLSAARNTPQTFTSLVHSRTTYNLTLYLFISLLEAYTVGTIVTFYDTTIVLEALLITVGLFLGLTLFTLQSKWDFSGMGPFLFGGLWALVLAGFVMLFFPHNGYEIPIPLDLLYWHDLF